MTAETFSALAMTRESAHAAAQAAYAHAQALLRDGVNVLVTCGPALEPITIKQRKFLHGPVLTQISEQVRVNGERFVIEVWKAYYKRLFLGHRWEMRKLPGQKRATPRKVEVSTEELGVKAYAAFTDQVIDHATLEWGVVFQFDAVEREAVRARPHRRAARVAEHA